jgi:hypothetical protein
MLYLVVIEPEPSLGADDLVAESQEHGKTKANRTKPGPSFQL